MNSFNEFIKLSKVKLIYKEKQKKKFEEEIDLFSSLIKNEFIIISMRFSRFLLLNIKERVFIENNIGYN